MQKRVLFFTGFSSLENGSQEILLALFYSGGKRRVTGESKQSHKDIFYHIDISSITEVISFSAFS